MLRNTNNTGDRIIKPVLMYCSLSPQDVQGKKKCHLPVFQQSSKNVWVGKQLMQDWFNSPFVHEIHGPPCL